MLTTNTQSDEISAVLCFTDPNDSRDTSSHVIHGTWKQVNDKIIKLREFMSIWDYKEEV